MGYFYWLMSAPLPDRLDPWRAVQSGAAFEGEAALDELPRLAAAVIGADVPVRYSLRFELDGQGRALVSGSVSTVLRLTCQRCLGEVPVLVDTPIAIALVRASSDADRLGLTRIAGLPDDLDAMPVGDEPIHVMDWVEDELLLAIPQVPMHPPGLCEPDAVAVPNDDALVKAESPFAVLGALRGTKTGPGADEN